MQEERKGRSETDSRKAEEGMKGGRRKGAAWVEEEKRREGTRSWCQAGFSSNRACRLSGPPQLMTSAVISLKQGGPAGVQLCSANLPAFPTCWAGSDALCRLEQVGDICFFLA